MAQEGKSEQLSPVWVLEHISACCFKPTFLICKVIFKTILSAAFTESKMPFLGVATAMRGRDGIRGGKCGLSLGGWAEPGLARQPGKPEGVG